MTSNGFHVCQQGLVFFSFVNSSSSLVVLDLSGIEEERKKVGYLGCPVGPPAGCGTKSLVRFSFSRDRRLIFSACRFYKLFGYLLTHFWQRIGSLRKDEVVQ